MMLVWSKGETLLKLNGAHNIFFDLLFKYLTKLGEIWGGVAVGIILLLFKKLKFFYIYLIAIGISSTFAQVLKTQVFADSKRPANEFVEELHKVDGIDLHNDYSFPSGHTTAAFCMFSILAFSMEKRRWQISMALLALFVGFSRIYLGQHYLMDVVAGCILGTVVATIVFISLQDKFIGKTSNKRLLGAL